MKKQIIILKVASEAIQHELAKKNLSHDQYERELRKIIDELGV